MSERQLRDFIEQARDDIVNAGGWTEERLDEVMAEEPDVINVLRLLKQYHDSPLATPHDQSHIAMLAHGIRREFGVNETDEGWEYVND